MYYLVLTTGRILYCKYAATLERLKELFAGKYSSSGYID